MSDQITDDEIRRLTLPRVEKERAGFSELSVEKFLRLVYSVNQFGRFEIIRGSNPTAGNEISEIITRGELWRIHSIYLVLTTSATVATRRVQFVADVADPQTTVSVLEAPVTQAASLTRGYSLINGLGYEQTAFSDNEVALPLTFPILAQGMRFRTLTINLQTGDDWDAPFMLIERMGIQP